MNKNNQISEKEAKYLKELIPRLLKYPARKWVQISDIANNVGEFIDIVQRLCDARYFDDDSGYCLIEIKEDSLVRLDPEYIKKNSLDFASGNRSTITFKKIRP